jgi:hypothetical protein
MIRNDISWNDYLGIKRMNPSTLVCGRKSMLHLKQAIDGGTHEDTQPLSFGRGFHSVTLKQGTHIVIPPFHLDAENRLKNGELPKSPKATGYYKDAVAKFREENRGYDILTQEEFEEIQAMSAAVWSKPLARKILETCGENKEVTLEGEICGVPFKGRVDILCPSIIADLKTCNSIENRAFGGDCVKYGYNFKMALYQELVRQNSCHRQCVYIAVEKSAPYDVCVRPIPDDLLAVKLRQAKKILERYKICLESGVWPGVDQGNDDELLYVPEYEYDEEPDWSPVDETEEVEQYF